MKEKINDWLNTYLPLAKASDRDVYSLHIEEWADTENLDQQELFDITLNIFNDICAVVKNLDLSDCKLFLSMELLARPTPFTHKPRDYQELIEMIDTRWDNPEVLLYKPQLPETNIQDISEQFVEGLPILFPIHFSEIRTEGILTYMEYPDIPDDEDTEYRRFLNFYLKEQTTSR